MIDVYNTRILPPDARTQALILKHKQEETSEEARRLKYALALAQVPEAYWTLQMRGIPESEATRDVRKYVQNIERFVLRDHLGLFLFGGAGVGKTFLVSHIARKALEHEFSVWFHDTIVFRGLVTTAAKSSGDGPDALLRLRTTISRADLLIVDGILQGDENERIRNQIYKRLEEILRMRQNFGATIFTQTVVDKTRRFPFPDDIMSLIEGMMHKVKVEGRDLRKNAATKKFQQI